MLRLVAREDDGARVVVLDRHKRMPGRGIWLHPDEHCYDIARRRSAFARALRLAGPVELDQVLQALQAVLHDADSNPGPTSAPGSRPNRNEQNADEHPMSTQR